jgi:hypothetical protein
MWVYMAGFDLFWTYEGWVIRDVGVSPCFYLILSYSTTHQLSRYARNDKARGLTAP